MQILENYSYRERYLAANLIVDIVVAVYYSQAVLSLSVDEYGEIGRIIVKTIVLAILLSLVVFGFLCRDKKQALDERDMRVRAYGNGIGYWVLTILMMFLMGQFLLEDSVFRGTSMIEYALNTKIPLYHFHAMLFALITADTARTLSQLIRYRRGYE